MSVRCEWYVGNEDRYCINSRIANQYERAIKCNIRWSNARKKKKEKKNTYSRAIANLLVEINVVGWMLVEINVLPLLDVAQLQWRTVFLGFRAYYPDNKCDKNVFDAFYFQQFCFASPMLFKCIIRAAMLYETIDKNLQCSQHSPCTSHTTVGISIANSVIKMLLFRIISGRKRISSKELWWPSENIKNDLYLRVQTHLLIY